MTVLPGVLGCRILRRTVQVHLRSNSLRFPGGTPIFFALAALRSVPQAGSQFRGLATAIHETSGLDFRSSLWPRKQSFEARSTHFEKPAIIKANLIHGFGKNQVKKVKEFYAPDGGSCPSISRLGNGRFSLIHPVVQAARESPDTFEATHGQNSVAQVGAESLGTIQNGFLGRIQFL